MGALAGAVLGILFSFSGREMIFPVVLGIGCVWLAMIQMIIWHQPAALQLPPPISSKTSTRPSSSNQSLSGDEARAWLDDFLADQQKK